MKTFLLTFLGGLAALVVFFVLLPLAILLSLMPSAPEVPASKMVLELDLRDQYPDQPATDSVSALFSDVSFVEILLRLDAAATDQNVKGVFVRAAEMDLGSTRAEELREAFKKLRAHNKFVIAHSQGFLASGPAAYRAVSAADEVWMQPGSSFEVPGITFEQLYLGDALKKLKVTPEIEQFLEYKSAAEVYKTDRYSDAAREAMTALATSVWDASIADIAADRNLDAGVVREALESSPHMADETIELKLADKLGWPEDAADEARKRGDADLVPIADYRPNPKRGKAVIAIVGGEGEIITGPGASSMFGGSAQFASDRVAGELLALADDNNVDAVVFRIDSPGGSATASDQVWRAVQRLRESGKKVVVSMGSLAASGGYYSAVGADAIVANRATITGSIGVFGGKFAIADGLRMIGVNPDMVQVGGGYASVYSTEKLTNYQRSKLLESLSATYERFTSLVADGRHMPKDKVLEIARGRVWSGDDALKLGLVDETGGLIDAIHKARDLAGFSEEDGVDIRLRLHRASPLQLLQGFLVSAEVSAANPEALQAISAIAKDPHAAAALRQIEAMSRQSGTQLYTPPPVER
ncbi:MAG: signal peptide peptidase SppA [Hyphomonadaceae bacterium]